MVIFEFEINARSDNMFNVGHIISLGIILFGIAVIVISALIIRRITRNCNVKIDAIESLVTTNYSYKSHRYRKRANYTFEFNGKEYTVGPTGSSPANNVGKIKTIHIDPQNPERYYRNLDLLIPIFIIVWGVLVILGGFINFIISFFF